MKKLLDQKVDVSEQPPQIKATLNHVPYFFPTQISHVGLGMTGFAEAHPTPVPSSSLSFPTAAEHLSKK